MKFSVYRDLLLLRRHNVAIGREFARGFALRVGAMD